MLKEKNNKIHVVHILPTLNVGGAEKFVLELTKYVTQENIKQSILILKPEEPLASEIPENVDLKILDFDNTSYWRRVKLIKKYLQEVQADIVHTHLFGGDFWGRLAAKACKLPIITTEHNINVSESKIRALIKLLMHNYSQVYTAPSQAVADYMRSTYHVSEDKTKVIRHGIELKRFSNILSAKFEEPIRLAVIGRLTEQKGHKVAIDALSKISDLSVVLNITGSGDIKDDLIAYAKEKQVLEKINWHEAMKQVENAYEQADIVLVPSLWEGLGLVVLEAMASERLVIASAVDGIKEIIEDKKTGYLFEKADSEELASLIRKVIEERQDSLQIAKQARDWAIKNVGVEDMANKYEKLYLSLLPHKADK